MKKTFATTLLIAALSITTSPVFSVSSNLENKLLEQALIEGAVTDKQKTAVANYLNTLAAAKKKQAESYREMAQVNYGGKAVAQDLKSKKLLNLAKSLDELAASYESLATNFSPAEYQRLSQLTE